MNFVTGVQLQGQLKMKAPASVTHGRMASLCQHIGALNRHCASGGGAFSQLKLDEDTVSIQVHAEGCKGTVNISLHERSSYPRTGGLAFADGSDELVAAVESVSEAIGEKASLDHVLRLLSSKLTDQATAAVVASLPAPTVQDDADDDDDDDDDAYDDALGDDVSLGPPTKVARSGKGRMVDLEPEGDAPVVRQLARALCSGLAEPVHLHPGPAPLPKVWRLAPPLYAILPADPEPVALCDCSAEDRTLLGTDTDFKRWSGVNLVSGYAVGVRPPALNEDEYVERRYTQSFVYERSCKVPARDRECFNDEPNRAQTYVFADDPACRSRNICISGGQAWEKSFPGHGALPPEEEEEQRKMRMNLRCGRGTRVRLLDADGWPTMPRIDAVTGFHERLLPTHRGWISPSVFVSEKGKQSDLRLPPRTECTMPECTACDANGDQRVYAFHWRVHCPCYCLLNRHLRIEGLLPYVNLHNWTGPWP